MCKGGKFNITSTAAVAVVYIYPVVLGFRPLVRPNIFHVGLSVILSSRKFQQSFESNTIPKNLTSLEKVIAAAASNQEGHRR